MFQDGQNTPAEGAHHCAGMDRLIRRLAVEAAPVWSGDKPAMTFLLDGCRKRGEPCPEAVFMRHAGSLLPALGLSARLLRRSASGCQWLFYDRERLAACLAARDAAAFLAARGWPHGIDEALDRLAAEFSAAPGRCPPETGIFLGYPVHDVASFAERPGEALNLRGALWRVFAPAAESLRLMARIRKARARLIHLLALESDAFRAISLFRGLPAAG